MKKKKKYKGRNSVNFSLPCLMPDTEETLHKHLFTHSFSKYLLSTQCYCMLGTVLDAGDILIKKKKKKKQKSLPSRSLTSSERRQTMTNKTGK